MKAIIKHVHIADINKMSLQKKFEYKNIFVRLFFLFFSQIELDKLKKCFENISLEMFQNILKLY